MSEKFGVEGLSSYKYLAWAGVVFLIFLILQMGFSFKSQETFLSFQGLMHLIWLFSFLIMVFVSLRLEIKAIFFLVLIYQLVAVFSIYSLYIIFVGNPLGPSPIDALSYHDLALRGRYVNFNEFLQLIPSRWDISDFGFPLVGRYVYMFLGDPIFNMKLLNILFHMGSTFFVFRSARAIGYDKYKVKWAAILFGLYPATVFFNASGLKETIFVFFVSASIFFMLASFRRTLSLNTGLAGSAILLTGFFRIFYPIFLLFSYFAQMYNVVSGRYKLFLRITVLVSAVTGIFLLLIFFQESLVRIFAVSIFERQSYRAGTEVGLVENTLFIIVSVIGPLPNFEYSKVLDNYSMQTVPNFIKVMLSLPFLISLMNAFKSRLFFPFSLWLFVGMNFIMLVLSASAFDHRLHYPFIPAYILLSVQGIDSGFDVRHGLFWLYVICSIFLITLYNIR